MLGQQVLVLSAERSKSTWVRSRSPARCDVPNTKGAAVPVALIVRIAGS